MGNQRVGIKIPLKDGYVERVGKEWHLIKYGGLIRILDEFESDFIEKTLDYNTIEYHKLLAQRNYAINLLAEWVVDVDNDTSWDGWDENFKEAKYRANLIRDELDYHINLIRIRNGSD